MRRLVPLLALSLALSPAIGQRAEWSSAEPLTVTLTNFAFTPESLVLEQGRIYRLHIVNAASGGHNFVARDFFRRATIAPQDAAKLRNGAVEVPAGGSVDIRLMAPAAGEYDLHCSHFLHTAFGMSGEIVVR